MGVDVIVADIVVEKLDTIEHTKLVISHYFEIVGSAWVIQSFRRNWVEKQQKGQHTIHLLVITGLFFKGYEPFFHPL